ncbi:MAG: protein jag [Candidatus Gracilibacteria bacterium]
MNLAVELTTITKELLEFLGIDTSSLEVSETEKNTYKIQIESDDAPLLIGKHGDTLMALQHLVKAMVKKKNDDEIILIMDVGNYREQYESKILLMAKQKAEKVMQEDVRETLFPMNSYHRRVVHTYIVSEFPGIETDSIGEEPNRRITLKKKGV